MVNKNIKKCDNYIIINNSTNKNVQTQGLSADEELKQIQKYIETSGLKNTMETFASELKKIMSIYTNNISQVIEEMNIGKFVSEYIKEYQKIAEGILKNIGILPKSKISGYDTTILDKYYWVIPFEYKLEKLDKLHKYGTRIKFEKYMLKYYSDSRVKKLFIKIKRQFKKTDKKNLIRQIENSYYNGDYAICITALMTLIDGATLILIHPNSWNQHKSHNAIGSLVEIMGKESANEFNYELFLRTNIINNFLNRLYPTNYDLKKGRRKTTLVRDINSHGVRYFNNKINALRLLNAVYYLNEVINDINMNEQFYSKRNEKGFCLVDTTKTK